MLAAGPGLDAVDLRYKTFEPLQQVAHRLELSGGGWGRGLRAGSTCAATAPSRRGPGGCGGG